MLQTLRAQRLRTTWERRDMDDLIGFLRAQIAGDRIRAGDGPYALDIDFKQAVFDLHRPRFTGDVWVCDGCGGYDPIRRRPLVRFAPCGQFEALARVYSIRRGFNPDWVTPPDEV